MDSSRLKIIKCLWEMQKGNGEVPGLSLEEYIERFNNARKKLNKK